jgi:hypothetical protein
MNTNGYVPAGHGYGMNGIQDLTDFGLNPTVPLVDPISSVLSMINSLSEGQGMYFPIERHEEMDQYVRRHINPLVRHQVSFLLHLNASQIRAVPEQIKNKVLDWACALEQAGVHGDGPSFNEQEKQIGHSVTINISGSQIEQLNNMGNNIQRASWEPIPCAELHCAGMQRQHSFAVLSNFRPTLQIG